MDALPCSAIAYRALRKKWADPVTKQVSVNAFLRRPNEDGLSVDLLSAASCVTVLTTKCGAASLHVGRVRDLALDVVVDDHPHANLLGLPRPEDDLVRAEYLANQLAKQARFIPLDQC